MFPPFPILEELEDFFREDLSSVRILFSALPARYGAHATVLAGDIHLHPRTIASPWLLAHECAHLVQARRGRWRKERAAALEIEADEKANRFLGRHYPAIAMAPPRPCGTLLPRHPDAPPCAIWRWNGIAWVPVSATKNPQPNVPGFFIGQEYNDENGMYGVPPSPQEDLQHALEVPRGFGLDSQVEKARFVINLSTLMKNRQTFKGIIDRGNKTLEECCNITFFKGVLRCLDCVGVDVPVKFQFLQSLRATGSFSHETWVISVNREMIMRFLNTASEDEAKNLLVSIADSLYHESRHCEQVFRILQFMAGCGFPKAKIMEITDVPQQVVDLAWMNPLHLPATGWNPEALYAMRWFQSFFGVNAAARRQTLRDMQKVGLMLDTWRGMLYATKLQRSLGAFSGLKADEEVKRLTSGVMLLQDEYDVCDEEYRALAEEMDAWDVGGSVGSAMSGGNMQAFQTIGQHFEIGAAMGTGNNCLLDTLYQLANGITVSRPQNIETIRQVLVHAGFVVKGQMLDIYGAEGAQLLQALNIRIQVIQIIGGVAFAHPVIIGTGGPLHYVLHSGMHFVPLRPKGPQLATLQNSIFQIFKRR